jgi:hypothetical protein
MRKLLRKPQAIYTTTTVLWLTGMLAHCVWRTHAALSGHLVPTFTQTTYPSNSLRFLCSGCLHGSSGYS